MVKVALDIWVKRNCKNCDKSFKARRCDVLRGKMKFCSRSCGNKGPHNGRWKGGRSATKKGYIKVFSPDHPRRDYKNQVYEHRIVVEKHIGRYLKVQEVVHHINEIKSDNRIENLILFSNETEHRKHHAKIRKYNRTL